MGIVLGTVLSMTTAVGVAHADAVVAVHMIDQGLDIDTSWPAPPPGQGLTLDQKIVDRMTELGNRAALHIDTASHNTVGLHIDGRHQRAQLRLMAGNTHYLSLRMDEDVVIGDGKARIASTVDLGVAGRCLHVELPDVEMLPDAYQGSQYVEVRVPIYERRW